MRTADTLSVHVMPRRQDPVPPVPDRVDALLAGMTVARMTVVRMSVAGKVAQLGSRRVGNWRLWRMCSSRGADPLPSGRSARTVRQLARFAQVRLEPGARVRDGAQADRTAFTGRELTQIVGRVEGDGLDGTSPDGLGAGLPYG